MATYHKDGVTRVLEVLKDNFGDYFKAYVEGLTDEVPSSLLPCVIADTKQGVVAAGATGTDWINETVTLVVVFNERDYLDPNSSMTNQCAVALRQLVLGQDPSTQQYVEESIMYTLRKHFTLNEGTVENRIDFDFYAGQRGEELFTRECELTLNIRRLALVPARD